jgi:hypothetical protein
MPFLVASVAATRVPYKVRKCVVGGIAIEMPPFQSWRAWTDKGFQNEMVNEAATDGSGGHH